jgi:hypothetical protein
MDFSEIKKIMGPNFIGPKELETISSYLKIMPPTNFSEAISKIPFTIEQLKSIANTHVLFFGIPFHQNNEPVTINSLRDLFGTSPEIKEPCFYNQDWYLNEAFANASFEPKWYLLSKNIKDSSRGKEIDKQNKSISTESLPSAVLCVYFFFLNYFHSGKEFVFEYDYVWNSDLDANGDRIFIGKYRDRLGLNKNGIEIHRHLSIKPNYGTIEFIINGFSPDYTK